VPLLRLLLMQVLRPRLSAPKIRYMDQKTLISNLALGRCVHRRKRMVQLKFKSMGPQSERVREKCAVTFTYDSIVNLLHQLIGLAERPTFRT
jgi:hypothetical protein